MAFCLVPEKLIDSWEMKLRETIIYIENVIAFQGAVKEVFDKVLSEPIRPHFAIACVGVQFSLEDTHNLVIDSMTKFFSVYVF